MLDRLSRDIGSIAPGVLRYGFAISLLIVLALALKGGQIFEFTSLREASSLQDFWAFHAAAQTIPSGFVSSLYDAVYFQSLFARDTGLLWLYPPTMLILLEPFAAMSYGHAKAIWVLSSIAGFAALAFYVNGKNTVLMVLAVLSPAMYSVLYTGQLGVLFAILLVVGLVHAKSRPLLAGLCLGLLSVKPQLGLLVPFFLIFTGAWRAFIVAGIVTVSLCIGSVALYGTETWVAFWNSLTNTHISFVQSEPGNGRIAFIDILRLGGLSRVTAAGIAGSVLIMSIPILRLAARQVPDQRALAALTIMLTIITTPYLWIYEWVFVVLAVFLFLSTKPDLSRKYKQGLLLLVWYMPLLPYLGLGINFGPLAWASALAMTVFMYRSLLVQGAENPNQRIAASIP